MPKMILSMSIATLIYIVATALVWLIWKREKHSLFHRIMVGLFFGGCSIASTHLGIDFSAALLNVRDIGPLAAGLFFDPLSGIIAGLLGGIERYIAGSGQFLSWTFDPIAPFTQVACSVSTCLAGFLAAFLNRYVYNGKRPTVPHSFFLGALMEVFHMYAVFITHRDNVTMASSVVSVCAVPMIVFTGLGVAGCCFVVLLASGDRQYLRLRIPESERPLTMRFQRWMLAVTLAVFGINTFITYQLTTRAADQENSISLTMLNQELIRLYTEQNDFAHMEQTMDTLLVSANSVTLYFVAEKDTGVVVSGTYYSDERSFVLDNADLETIREHTNIIPFKTNLQTLYGFEALCSCSELGDRYYMLLAIPSDSMYENRNTQMYENLLSDILVYTVLYILINLLVEYLVVRNLQKINASLDRITHGKLDETVSVNASREFAELSTDINKTVTALRGYIDAAEKRMEEELKLAKEIQASALPRVFEFSRHDFEIYALMTPARQVGGDFYDFFFIDADHMALVIADVSGKGIPAALFMMRAKTAVKQYARSGYGPGRLLEEVNSTLCEGNDAEMFVTVWIGIINLRTGLMHCANAGHEYPVLMRSGGEYELMKDRHGLALAAMDGAHMREYELQLNPGDRIFVYTDGVPEAINEKEEAYGTDRLVQALNRVRTDSEQTVLESTLSDLRAFVGGADQFDDITMLGFTYNGPEQK